MCLAEHSRITRFLCFAVEDERKDFIDKWEWEDLNDGEVWVMDEWRDLNE